MRMEHTIIFIVIAFENKDAFLKSNVWVMKTVWQNEMGSGINKGERDEI